MPTGSTLVLISQSFVKPLFSLFYEYTFVSSIPPSFPLPKPVSYPSYPLSILSDAPTFTWACGYNALYKRPSSFLSVRRDLFWMKKMDGDPNFEFHFTWERESGVLLTCMYGCQRQFYSHSIPQCSHYTILSGMRFLWAQTAPKQLDIRYPLMYTR